MANAEIRFGGWTGFRFEIPAEDKALFDKVVSPVIGVSYTPLAVATQVVAGFNYCFLCKGVASTEAQDETAYLVYIYQPPTGEAVLREIRQIKPY